MISGIVFDIKEFAVHDGPGIRTTVFLKGCPLSCTWCHNPEGQSREPQILHSPVGERVAGQVYSSESLALRLNRQASILKANEGGVTFSGGEPLLQAAFVAEVIDQLDDLHVLLDTSGYGSEDHFRLLAGRADLVHFDLKIIDDTLHRRFTGCSNAPILRNLHLLSDLGTPFIIRVPLAPGVTDTDENLSAIAETVLGLPGLVRVDLLPYNKMAGAKYRAAGMEFVPGFDETRESRAYTAIFEKVGLNVKVT